MSDHSLRGFDPKKEAEIIIHLAKDRLDTSGTEDVTAAGREASRKLANEWSSLTWNQRMDTMDALFEYNGKSHRFDALPTVKFAENEEGKIVGMEFEASFWDFHSGPHAIQITADDGVLHVNHQNTQTRMWQPMTYSSEFKIAEGLANEKPSKEFLAWMVDPANPRKYGPNYLPYAPPQSEGADR